MSKTRKSASNNAPNFVAPGVAEPTRRLAPFKIKLIDDGRTPVASRESVGQQEIGADAGTPIIDAETIVPPVENNGSDAPKPGAPVAAEAQPDAPNGQFQILPFNAAYASEPQKNILSVMTSADGEAIVQAVPINLLTHHPSQTEIYEEVVPDDPIFESVSSRGILHPLTVNERGQVLNGNRRLVAGKQCEIVQVKVIVVPNRTLAEETEYLIQSNLNRVKTPEEVAREAAALMKIETARAAERQANGARAKKRGKVPVKSPEDKANGEARNIVAKKLGIGGSKVAQSVRVIDMLDQLEAEEKIEKAAELRGYLNKSVSLAAKKLVTLTVDSKPEEEVPEEKEESKEPQKGDILTDVWINLSRDMHRWPVDKIQAFKTAVMEFRKGWEANYVPIAKEAK